MWIRTSDEVRTAATHEHIFNYIAEKTKETEASAKSQ